MDDGNFDDEFFELDRISEWITENDFKRIALQLPNDLLKYSVQIVANLEQRLDNIDRKLFVLADTSYRSCCLDEIAAEHAACDCIVHFGDACLSVSISHIPAIYIFCRCLLDMNRFREQFEREMGNNHSLDSWDEAILICEAGYTHVQDQLEELIGSLLPSKVQLCNYKIPDDQAQNGEKVLGRIVPKGILQNDEEGNDENRRFLIFVGSPDSPLLALFVMTLKNLQMVLNYLPETGRIEKSEIRAHKMLMKRFYLIERLRDAHTVGLVVGSASLRGCREAMARIRRLCQLADKKLYVIYIGKMNEAKLSNFGIEVEAFVLLSCPFGIMLDGTKFCRPILTLFEAEIALNPDRRDWLADMKWTADFEHLSKMQIANDGGQRDEADMNLTSGTIRCSRIATNGGNESKEANNAQMMEYTAGDYFSMRSWRGLEDQSGCDQQQCSCELKEGLNGIATGYSNEMIREKYL